MQFNRTPIEVKGRHEADLLRIDGVVGVVAEATRLVVLVESEEVCGRVPMELEGVEVACRVVGKVRI